MRKLGVAMACKYAGSIAWQLYTYLLILLGGAAPQVIAYVYWAELGRSLSEPLVSNYFLKHQRVTVRAIFIVALWLFGATLIYNAVLAWSFRDGPQYAVAIMTAMISIIPALVGWLGVHWANRREDLLANEPVRDSPAYIACILVISCAGILFARQFLFGVQLSQVTIPRDFALMERFYSPTVNVITTAITLGSALSAASAFWKGRDLAIAASGVIFSLMFPRYWMFYAATSIKTLTTMDYIRLLRSTRWHLLLSIPVACTGVFFAILAMGTKSFRGVLVADLVSGILYFVLMKGAALSAKQSLHLPKGFAKDSTEADSELLTSSIVV